MNLSLISLDPARFHSITKRDFFKKVLSNIHLLLSRNFLVKINVVVINGINEDEILDFVEWTKRLPLHIRFIEFMPFSGNQWDHAKVFSYQNILRTIGSRYDFAKLTDEKSSTAKAYRVKGFEGCFGVISTMTDPFCGDCNRLRLTADGKLRNCLFSKQETDLLTPLRMGKPIRPLILQTVKAKDEKHGG